MLIESLDWLARAQRMIPPADRTILLSPLRLVARFLRFALARHAGTSGSFSAGDVRARDPKLVALLMDFFRGVGAHYFRLRIEGVDQVPASGPVLLVGNHNGGLLPSDGFFTALGLYDRFGGERALYALVHDFLLDDPVLSFYAGRLGMLRAGHESARQVFAAGQCLLVYPGSDLDAFRPFAERRKVILGGRKGFLKLALREGVPIVPVVSAGTHEQMIVLTRGDGIARVVHAHHWARADIFPLMLALPWGLTVGFVPYLPLPAQTTIAFGAPMTWPDLGPGHAESGEALDRCYHDVEDRMQAMLDRLSEGRRFLLGPRAALAQGLPSAAEAAGPPAL